MKYSNANAHFSSRLKYSLLLSLKSILLFLMSCTSDSHSQTEPIQQLDSESKEVKVAASRLSEYLHYLEGKKVAIVANQTSLINDKHLVDTLLLLDVDVIKVFAPEHGFRGSADAGEEIKDNLDAKTG